MTQSEFHQLRRGDVIYGKTSNPDFGRDLWRVKGKASFNQSEQKMVITLINVIFPNQLQELMLSNLKEYDLTPHLKHKYSIKD